jgi:hypothetical protein
MITPYAFQTVTGQVYRIKNWSSSSSRLASMRGAFFLPLFTLFLQQAFYSAYPYFVIFNNN